MDQRQPIGDACEAARRGDADHVRTRESRLYNVALPPTDELRIAGCLEEAFGSLVAAHVVIDFIHPAISDQSTVAQHYPCWVRDHATRSGDKKGCNGVSHLLSVGVEPLKIEEFK